MATLRLATHVGSTKVFLTSIGTTTGTPNVSGYALTQVADLIHDATITGLTGPFSARAENDVEEVQAYVYPVTMVDADVLIDTTVDDETKIDTIVSSSATAATQATTAAAQSTAAASSAATAVTQTTKDAVRDAVAGRWTDEDGYTFDLTIADTQ